MSRALVPYYLNLSNYVALVLAFFSVPNYLWIYHRGGQTKVDKVPTHPAIIIVV